MRDDKKGFILILNGISASGKSTLASMLKEHLESKGIKSDIIDGDMTRKVFDDDMDLDREARLMAFKRNSFGAYMLSRNGINVIMACIIGLEEMRQFLDKKLGYIEVLLDADIKDCMQNDPKGVYKKNLQLTKPNIVGHDIPFHKPENPTLILKPYKEEPEQSLMKIINMLNEKGIINENDHRS